MYAYQPDPCTHRISDSQWHTEIVHFSNSQYLILILIVSGFNNVAGAPATLESRVFCLGFTCDSDSDCPSSDTCPNSICELAVSDSFFHIRQITVV